jgi:hypothetical protein
MCSIDGYDIFGDYVGSGQLFVDSSFVFENIYKFPKLDAHVCSLNVFSQFFDPYISLGLDNMASLKFMCCR